MEGNNLLLPNLLETSISQSVYRNFWCLNLIHSLMTMYKHSYSIYTQYVFTSLTCLPYHFPSFLLFLPIISFVSSFFSMFPPSLPSSLFPSPSYSFYFILVLIVIVMSIPIWLLTFTAHNFPQWVLTGLCPLSWETVWWIYMPLEFPLGWEAQWLPSTVTQDLWR